MFDGVMIGGFVMAMTSKLALTAGLALTSGSTILFGLGALRMRTMVTAGLDEIAQDVIHRFSVNAGGHGGNSTSNLRTGDTINNMATTTAGNAAKNEFTRGVVGGAAGNAAASALGGKNGIDRPYSSGERSSNKEHTHVATGDGTTMMTDVSGSTTTNAMLNSSETTAGKDVGADADVASSTSTRNGVASSADVIDGEMYSGAEREKHEQAVGMIALSAETLGGDQYSTDKSSKNESSMDKSMHGDKNMKDVVAGDKYAGDAYTDGGYSEAAAGDLKTVQAGAGQGSAYASKQEQIRAAAMFRDANGYSASPNELAAYMRSPEYAAAMSASAQVKGVKAGSSQSGAYSDASAFEQAQGGTSYGGVGVGGAAIGGNAVGGAAAGGNAYGGVGNAYGGNNTAAAQAFAAGSNARLTPGAVNVNNNNNIKGLRPMDPARAGNPNVTVAGNGRPGEMGQRGAGPYAGAPGQYRNGSQIRSPQQLVDAYKQSHNGQVPSSMQLQQMMQQEVAHAQNHADGMKGVHVQGMPSNVNVKVGQSGNGMGGQFGQRGGYAAPGGDYRRQPGYAPHNYVAQGAVPGQPTRPQDHDKNKKPNGMPAGPYSGMPGMPDVQEPAGSVKSPGPRYAVPTGGSGSSSGKGGGEFVKKYAAPEYDYRRSRV